MNVYGYPKELENPLKEDEHDNIFYMFDDESKSINGYRYYMGRFLKIWNFYLAPNVL